MDSLYSCFIIDAAHQRYAQWDLFSYSRSQTIPQTDPSIAATLAHTNVPRTGDSGLPMGWAMQVDHWRATTNLRFLNDPVLEWASQTETRLVYNGRPIAVTPLVDILMAPHPLSDPSGDDFRTTRLGRGEPVPPQPMLIRENLSYRVEVSSPQSAIDQLRVWLVEHTIELQEKGRSADTSTWKPRLMCWVWLEGVLSRSAY